MQFQSSLLALATLILCVSFSDAASCIPKFKNVDMFQTAQDVCIKRVIAKGHNLTDIPKPEDMEKNKFDDKCLANCTLGEMNLFKNMTVQVEAMVKMFNENAPQDAKEKLVKIIHECAEKTSKKNHEHKDGKEHKENKKSEKHTGSTVSPKFHHKMMKMATCKIASKFVHCVMQKEKEVC